MEECSRVANSSLTHTCCLYAEGVFVDIKVVEVYVLGCTLGSLCFARLSWIGTLGAFPYRALRNHTHEITPPWTELRRLCSVNI